MATSLPHPEINSHNKWKKNKTKCIISFILLLILYQIPCFSNGWLVTEKEYLGLWQTCSESLGCHWMKTSPSYDSKNCLKHKGRHFGGNFRLKIENTLLLFIY